MSEQPTTLRDLLEQAAGRHGDGQVPATGRRLAEIAESNGWPLTHTTINHLLAGTYTSRPTRRTLEAIAKLAGVGEDLVFEAAGRPLAEVSFAEQLPENVDDLSPVQRRAVLIMIRAFLEPGAEDEAQVVAEEIRERRAAARHAHDADAERAARRRREC